MTKRLCIAIFCAAILLLPVCCLGQQVLVNQVGYEPNAPKIFRFQRTADFAGSGTFSVRRASDQVEVFSGDLIRKGPLWNRFYWEGDFSAFKTPGDYYIQATVNAESGTSYSFAIGEGVFLNKTGKLTYQYFQSQRCGTAVSLQYINRNGDLVTWSKNACHLDDGYIYQYGPQIDCTGGWHDAGDYGKYGHGFAGNPVSDLLWLYETNKDYYDALDDNSNGIPDIVDEALWQARWLVKMVDGNGHVMEQLRQRRTGASWVKPESDTNNIIGTSDDRWIDVGTENTPQETVVCAALIKMHRVCISLGLPTENFAAKALAIWNHRVAWAEANGGHNNLGSGAHQIWAALDLYAVYGQQNCWDRGIQAVNELIDRAINNPAMYDTSAEPPGYELGVLAWFIQNYPTHPSVNGARQGIESLMNRYINYLACPVTGLIRRVEAGGALHSLPAYPSLGFNRLYGLLAWAAIESYKIIGDPAYLRFAMDQYNWILGANYHTVCMMEAAGKFHVDKYHTRYDTFATNGIQPGVVMNGYIRDSNGNPWVYFGTGSASVEANEGWLPNNAGYAMALAAMSIFKDLPQVTINDNKFSYGNDGWTVSVWKSGPYDPGVMARNGSVGNPGGAMRCSGSGQSDNNDRSTREGGEIRKTISTAGFDGIKVSYDLRVNSLGSNHTGSGIGIGDVDHGIIDEQLTVFYLVDGGSNWVEADWTKRDALLANYQSYGTREIDLSLVHAASDNPNFTLRFRWQLNHGSDLADLDNIVVTGVRTGSADTTPPVPVTAFGAIAGESQVSLSWTNPSDSDFIGTKIVYKTTGYPSGPTDGTIACDKLNTAGTNDSFTHTGLTGDVTYYYAAYAYDPMENYSTAATAGATPVDTTPPSPVTGFSATNNPTHILLSWTNPTNPDFAGTRILFKTSGYPIGPNDGTVIHSGAGTSAMHSGISSGTLCYYRAYAYDAVLNYALPASVQITRSGPCLADEFSYPNSNLNGNSGWAGTATSQITVVDGTVRINGGTTSFDAIRNVSCSPSGSQISVQTRIRAGFGADTIWIMYIDDAAGANFARWYGSGTNLRGRIGGTGLVTPQQNLTGTSTWDDLEVIIDVAADTSQFFFKGQSIGTYSHSSQGAGDSIGRIRFESIDNNSANGHYVLLDDLVVGGETCAPPAPVTNFKAFGGSGQVTLIWTNPAGGDYAGTMIRFKTGGYPSGPTDGTSIYTGTGTSYTHAGLTNGTRYYYSAFANSSVPGCSSAKIDAAAHAAATASILDAKGLANNQVRALRGNIVTALGSGYFYLQDPLALQGMKAVASQSVTTGQKLDVIGVMGGSGAERWIDVSGSTIVITNPGPIALAPIGMSGTSVGGSLLNTLAPGIVDGTGPNNIGLLALVWGRVTQRDKSLGFFYIDDGSGLRDGTTIEVSPGVFEESVGIRILANPTSYPKGSYVTVKGAVSSFNSNGLRPSILPATGGIQLLTP